jgi:hypothetical protein
MLTTLVGHRDKCRVVWILSNPVDIVSQNGLGTHGSWDGFWKANSTGKSYGNLSVRFPALFHVREYFRQETSESSARDRFL